MSALARHHSWNGHHQTVLLFKVNSRPQRVLWMLEDFEFPYKIQTYTRDTATLFASDALRRLQPMIDENLDAIEAHLASKSWFAGESITAISITMSFALEAAAHSR